MTIAFPLFLSDREARRHQFLYPAGWWGVTGEVQSSRSWVIKISCSVRIVISTINLCFGCWRRRWEAKRQQIFYLAGLWVSECNAYTFYWSEKEGSQKGILHRCKIITSYYGEFLFFMMLMFMVALFFMDLNLNTYFLKSKEFLTIKLNNN